MFTRRLKFDDYDRIINDSYCNRIYIVIFSTWLTAIFISFIPMFSNFGEIQYFPTQSQCDYTYETFKWWIMLFFFGFITIPFLGALFVFFLTFRLIYKADRMVKVKKSQFELEQSRLNKSHGLYFKLNFLIK